VSLQAQHVLPGRAEVDAEALFKEARRRRRRRWLIFGVGTVAGLLGLIFACVALGGSGGNRLPTNSARTQASGSASTRPSRGRSAVASDVLPEVGVADLFAPGAGWVANGTLADVTLDNGKHWEPFRPPRLQGDFVAQIGPFAALGSRDWWVSVGLGPGGGPASGTACAENQAVLDYTTNAGTSWQQSDLPGCVGAYEISFATPSDGYALGGWPPSTLYSTTDGGSSWTEVGDVPFTGPIVFATQVDGWGVGTGNAPSGSGVNPHPYRNVLYQTTDAGRTWNAVSFPAIRLPGIESVRYGEPQLFGLDTAVVPVLALNDQGNILPVVEVTRDGGTTWRTVVTPSALGWVSNYPGALQEDASFSAVSPEHWILGEGGDLYVTTDGGDSWTLLTKIFAHADGSIDEVHFASAESGWVSTSPSRLYSTADGGKHWTILSE
jgi:photosystem II stability/assembly factor-like uncharacterized protein